MTMTKEKIAGLIESCENGVARITREDLVSLLALAERALEPQGQALPDDGELSLDQLMKVFDMGLGFALCHRDFIDTRNAVKKLQADFKVIQQRASQLALPAGLTQHQRDGIQHVLRKYSGMDPEADESWESWYSAAMDMISNEIGDVLAGIAPTAALPAGAIPKTHVECRQCDTCGHVGIDDQAQERAACNSCGWTGADPGEDKCPDCEQTGTMSAACPKCGERYHLIASADIASPSPAVAQPVLSDEDAELLRQAKELHDAFTEAVVPREGTLLERMQYLGRYVVALKDAEEKAAVAQPVSDERDAERLLWVSQEWGGHSIGYARHVLDRGGDGDLSDIRTFIDKHLPARAALCQPAEASEPVALKTHGAWDGLETLDSLPDGTELHAKPVQGSSTLRGSKFGWPCQPAEEGDKA